MSRQEEQISWLQRIEDELRQELFDISPGPRSEPKRRKLMAMLDAIRRKLDAPR